MILKKDFKLPKDVEESLFILNKYCTITKCPDVTNGLLKESADRIEAKVDIKKPYNSYCTDISGELLCP